MHVVIPSNIISLIRSMPIESLHTLLLGPYKYLLKSTIPTLSKGQKEEVLARVRAFNYSGFTVKLQGNVIRHHSSFVGRDYKAWAQMALFIIYPYLSNSDKKVWLSLSKVLLFLLVSSNIHMYYHAFRSSGYHTVHIMIHLKLVSGKTYARHFC